MPMQLFRRIGLVENINRYSLAFFQAKKRSGELPVVVGDRDNAIWCQFDGRGGDREGVVGWTLARRSSFIIARQRRLTRQVRWG